MKESQNKKVLNHLMSGKNVSSWYAIKTWRITRLSARIKDLRDSGYDIYGKMVEHSNSKFMLYYMEGSKMFDIHGKCYK